MGSDIELFCPNCFLLRLILSLIHQLNSKAPHQVIVSATNTKSYAVVHRYTLNKFIFCFLFFYLEPLTILFILFFLKRSFFGIISIPLPHILIDTSGHELTQFTITVAVPLRINQKYWGTSQSFPFSKQIYFTFSILGENRLKLTLI